MHRNGKDGSMRVVLPGVVAVICLGAVVFVGFAGAGVSVEEPSKVDALFAAVARSAGPGAAVLVVRDGKIIHEKGYGMANLEHEVPNTPGTKFRLGSITKSFTAIAILQLQEKGLLSIDDVAGKYLLDCPNAERITIRQL